LSQWRTTTVLAAALVGVVVAIGLLAQKKIVDN
jgi:hypothetical protein